MRNSLKQLLRTPGKAILFFILLAAVSTLLLIGSSLYADSTVSIKAADAQFHTIGTVWQKPNSSTVISFDDYYYMNGEYQLHHVDMINPDYDSYVPVDVLNFEGANYIYPPEHRPFYEALLEDYAVNLYTYDPEKSTWEYADTVRIAEITPLETDTPDDPMEMEILQVLYGGLPNKTLWYVDTTSENPQPLEKGKRHIGALLLQYYQPENSNHTLYSGFFHPYTSQRDKTGALLPSELLDNYEDYLIDGLEEVTEDFYETSHGQLWLEFAQARKKEGKTVPVLPTNSLELLYTYHEKGLDILDGREITQEEFDSGALVAMLPTQFAYRNQVKVGDKITLPLITANYCHPATQYYRYNSGPHQIMLYGMQNANLLNAEGKTYDVFWEAEYEVVGIYSTYLPEGVTDLGWNEFIIPAKSVQGSDDGNVVAYGAMDEFTASFEIPNGTSMEFDAALHAAVPEAEQLRIVYDDNGYEQIASGLWKTQSTALLLLAGGVAATAGIVALLLYFFILRQKKRTAIERSLGMGKRQCRVSLLAGILVLALLASIMGMACGALLLDKAEVWAEEFNTQEHDEYRHHFSLWAIGESDKVELGEPELLPPMVLYISIPLAMFLFILVFSLILIERNFKMEPIELLSAKTE